MPIQHYRIFDFDQTITKNHTFSNASLTENNKGTDWFAEGISNAKDNVKDQFPMNLFEMNSEYAFGIATYHNNPDYIAGYFQAILGKEITSTGIVAGQDSVAIHAYKIEGHEQPLLIAHIPQIGRDFDRAVRILTSTKGKNQHIRLLQEFASNEKYVDENTFYDFFDDSEGNVTKARELEDSHLNSHHVLHVTCSKNSFEVADQAALDASISREMEDDHINSHHALPDKSDESSIEVADQAVPDNLLAFILEYPRLVSGIVGLLVAVSVLAAFALAASPIGAVALLTAAGSGFFASAVTYAYTPDTSNLEHSPLTP